MERPRVRNFYVENMMEAEIVRLMTVEIGKMRQTGDITREDQLHICFWLEMGEEEESKVMPRR